MKTYVKSSLLVLLITVVSTFAQAQIATTQESKTWFGASASIHYIIPSLDIHIGIEDALGENIDLRTTLSGLAVDGGGFIGGGVNGIINLSDESSGVNSYIGFGPRGLLLLDGPSNSNIFSFAVGGLWGAEFFTQNSTRPFIELNASVPITAGAEVVPAFLPIISLSTGLNFRF